MFYQYVSEMPLRDFTIDALKKGFHDPDNDSDNPNASDMYKFKQKYSKYKTDINNIIGRFPLTDTINNIESTINEIIDEKKKLLNKVQSLTEQEKNVHDRFEYSREIKKIPEKTAVKLFVLRHLIFYQILIFVRLIVLNENDFNKYFTRYTDNDFKFNSNYNESEFDYFKLGIWGSVNVSSDIDIGFQYAKINDRKQGILAYIIEIFEQSFLHFTGRNTLTFDIEGYADLMYMDANPTIFYCNSSDFEWTDLVNSTDSTPSLLSSIVCSMIRNYVQAKIDKYHPAFDIRRFKSNAEISQDDINKINEDIYSFKFNDVITSLQKFKKDFNPDENIKKLIENKTINIDTVKEYLENIYNEGRKMYYTKVRLAENFLAQQSSALLGSTETLPKKNIRLQMMRLIACALNYRAESYVSPSTVTHIVRVLQANYTSSGKCNSGTFPKQDPTCVLGKMGYFMSMLEQMGYIYRFDITYCRDKDLDNDYDCINKIKKKYLDRFDKALEKYNKFQESTSGRARRSKYKKTKNNKKLSRKLHHCTFKSPNIGRFMSGMATLPCAFQMRKGVKTMRRRRRRSNIRRR